MNMNTPDIQAQQAVEYVCKLGAASADALAICTADTSVAIRQGKVESIERDQSSGLGLRVFIDTPKGPAFATASTSNLSAAGIRSLAEQTLAMARISEADPDAVPPQGADHPDAQALQQWSKHHAAEAEPWQLEQARDAALECEAVARQHDPRISNSEGSDAGFGVSCVAYASSDGFAGTYSKSSASLSVSVIAGSGDDMQRDYAWHRASGHTCLRTAAELGREAASRAVRKLGAGDMPSAAMPVIFEPRVATSLLGHLTAAINGRAVLQQRSFLAQSLDKQIFPSWFHLTDDPDHTQGLGNRLFDGEGTRCQRCQLIEDGVLTMFLTDRYAARRLELPARGHARRGLTGDISIGTSNLICATGSMTQQEILADIGNGLLVTELIGFGVNGVTGDYSRGAAGLLIENGEISRPVQGITIAGQLPAMFASISHLGSDLTWFGNTAVPTIAIDGMTIAGSNQE